MSLSFRLVLPAVEEVLTYFRSPDTVFTVLRDVEGRVRLVVEGISKPVDASLVVDIEQALRTRLGDWLGQQTPVWSLRTKRGNLTPSERAILEELDRTHVELSQGIYLVERHVSKAVWTGLTPYDPPWPPEKVALGDAPPVLTFFSHKGGVGRTTALLATGLGLAREGRSVVLVDLDLEAPGLDTLFGERLVPAVGVLDLLVHPNADGSPDVDEAVLDGAVFKFNETALVGDGTLRVVAAGQVDEAYMEMLARVDVHTGSNRSALLGRMRAIFKKVHELWSPEFILVDARAGFHDLGGLMLASLSHAAVMVLTANPQSIHGLRQVGRLLSAPYRAKGDPPVPLVLAHGLAPAQGSGGETERRALREIAYGVLKKVYYPPSSSVPDTDGLAHDPVALPWVPELRGRGGQLDAEVAAILRGEAYGRLIERVRRAVGK